jgi:hypothetical protein
VRCTCRERPGDRTVDFSARLCPRPATRLNPPFSVRPRPVRKVGRPNWACAGTYPSFYRHFEALPGQVRVICGLDKRT